MKKSVYVVLLCFFAIHGFTQTIPNLYAEANKTNMNLWVDSVFNQLSVDERIGQLFMVIANPKADAANMRKLMRYVNEIKLGGILFHKGSPNTQAEVTNQLQKASRVPLLVSLDGEWGLSMRLTNTTRFPKNMMLGAIENDSLIFEYGKEVARQCKELGIHINFAPALDVNSNTENPVIGMRSFGEDADAVANKGIAYARGLESMGIISVAKHFPGHGDTGEDSHYTLPVVRHSLSRLDSVELSPFKQYINAGFAGMMTAHLYVPALDKSKKPTSLSDAVVTDLLQNKMGFSGLCFTDALAMKGAGHNKKEENISLQALLAGNDVLLASATPLTDFEVIKKAIEDGTIRMQDIEAKCRKVLAYKYIAGLNNYRPIETKELSSRLNTSHAAWLASKLNAEAITLLKNEDNTIPLTKLDKRKIAVLSIGGMADNKFQQMLNEYGKIDCFYIERMMKPQNVAAIYNTLSNYDVIICGVHTVRIPESLALKQLAAKKELIYVFFTQPYFLKNYKASITNAKAVVMAYENTSLTEDNAAQLLFGGIGAKGKLPVSIPSLYYAGTGLFTEKGRLAYQEPEEAGINAERLNQIDAIVQEGLDAKAFPGCQVLVAKDGVVVYNKSFGYYDYTSGQEVTNASVYDLASVSKAVGTVPAVMKAYDEKKFTLNSKISEFIPELKNSNKSDLKIKELLYHQSGVVPTINFYTHAVDKKGNPEHLVSLQKKEEYTIEVARNFYVHHSFRDTIIQDIKKSKLRDRGKYKYSCVNFMMLKLMVESLMQQPMDELLHDHFYARLGAKTTMYNPLHLLDTACIVPTEEDTFIRKQMIRGYVHDEAAAFQGGVSGNAGLFSNATDLAKLLQLYLNDGMYGGERYLSTSTSRLFTQSKSPTSRRGLGFDKPSGNEGLAPLSTFGHTGFTGTCFWVDPTHQLIYIFLSNRVYPDRSNNKLSSMNIRTRIQDAIYKAIDSKTQKD